MGELGRWFADFTCIELVQLALGEGALVLAGEAAQDETEDEERDPDREKGVATGELPQKVAIHRQATGVISSPTRSVPCFVSWMRFTPKLTSVGSCGSRRKEARVLSGSLPSRSPVSWSV